MALSQRLALTTSWHDWIDYWSVDFDYESKPEVIKFKTEDGKVRRGMDRELCI